MFFDIIPLDEKQPENKESNVLFLHYDTILQPLIFCEHVIEELTKLHDTHSLFTQSEVYKLGPFLVYREIATGNWGRVLEVSFCCSSVHFAMKMLDVKNARFSFNLLAKEVGILRTLNHENLIQFYDILRLGDHFIILTELCPGRDLFYWLKSNSENNTNNDWVDQLPLSLRERLYIFEKVLHGVQYLWSRHIVHRDIKLENILYDRKNHKVKLCDFGLSTVVRTENQDLHQMCGSIHYVAPEITKGRPYKGESSTVWSLGITLYILLTNSYPFLGYNNQDTFALINRGKVKRINLRDEFGLSTATTHRLNWLVNNLLEEMLQVTPENRISLVNLLEHPLFKFTEAMTSFSEVCVIPSPNQMIQTRVSIETGIKRSYSVQDKKSRSLQMQHTQVVPPKSNLIRFFPLKYRRKLCDLSLLFVIWYLLRTKPKVALKNPTGIFISESEIYLASYLVAFPGSLEYTLYRSGLVHLITIRKIFETMKIHPFFSHTCKKCVKSQQAHTILFHELEERCRTNHVEIERENSQALCGLCIIF